MMFQKDDKVLVSSVILRNNRVRVPGVVVNMPTYSTVVVRLDSGEVHTFLHYEVELVNRAGRDNEVEALRKEVKELRERVDELTKPSSKSDVKGYKTFQTTPGEVKVGDYLIKNGQWLKVISAASKATSDDLTYTFMCEENHHFTFVNYTSQISVRRVVETNPVRCKDVYKQVKDVKVGDVLYYLNQSQYTEVVGITRTYRNGVVEYYLKGKNSQHTWNLYGESLVLVKEEAK